MLYLFGDSTESNLDFNFLAFLREVIDAAVVLVECEVILADGVERRRIRQLEADAVITTVDDFGRRAAQLVVPVAKEQAGTPVGRCAAQVAASIREAVEREAAQIRGVLAAERDEMDREDQRLQARARDALEKLLRTHDLPNPEKEIEVVWTGAGVKATMHQRTNFGVEAVLALDIPASSVLGLDLRVDRIAENVEVHTVGASGWLKRSDKLVAHKLGRYLIVGVTAGSHITLHLRATADANAAGFEITAYSNGDLTIEPTGGGSALAIDDRDRPGLRLLADRLEAAVRSLGDNRAGLVAFEIDGQSVAEHGHPRVLAERLMIAVAPTVQKIAQHSRSPGELVLRRLLGDNRREEIFVPIPELLRRLDGLPTPARAVFAPLQLEGETPAPQELPPEPQSQPALAVDARIAPLPPASSDQRSAPRRTTPPAVPYDRQRAVVPLPDPRRAARPSAPPPMFETHDQDQGQLPDHDQEEESTVVLSASSAAAAAIMSAATASTPPPPPRSPAPTTPPPVPGAEARSGFGSARHVAVALDEPSGSPAEPPVRKRPDDAALGKAIDVALDEDDEAPPAP